MIVFSAVADPCRVTFNRREMPMRPKIASVPPACRGSNPNQEYKFHLQINKPMHIRRLAAPLFVLFVLMGCTQPNSAPRSTPRHTSYYLDRSETIDVVHMPGFYECMTEKTRVTFGRRQDKSKCIYTNAREISAIRASISNFNEREFKGCIGDTVWNCIASLSRELVVTTYMDDLPWGSFDPGEKDILGNSVEKYDFKLSSIYAKLPGSDDGADITIKYQKATLVVTGITIDFPSSIRSARTVSDFNETSIYEYTIPIFSSSCDLTKNDLQKFVYINLFSQNGSYSDDTFADWDEVSKITRSHYYSKKRLCGVLMSYEDQYYESYSSDGHYMSGGHELYLR